VVPLHLPRKFNLVVVKTYLIVFVGSNAFRRGYGNRGSGRQVTEESALRRGAMIWGEPLVTPERITGRVRARDDISPGIDRVRPRLRSIDLISVGGSSSSGEETVDPITHMLTDSNLMVSQT